MGRASPRHVAATRQSGVRLRDHLVANSVLALIAIALTTALLVGGHRSQPGAQEVIPDGTPPSAPPSTPATPNSTAGGGTVGDANLLGDAGFEAGLAGWRPIGQVTLGRVSTARHGQWAASLIASGAADQGMALGEVTRCLPHKAYAATAWVRAERPGTIVELNLLEVVGGRRYATDTVGAVLHAGGWEHLEVAHVVHRSGVPLALEVVVPKAPGGATVLVDDLAVVAETASSMPMVGG